MWPWPPRWLFRRRRWREAAVRGGGGFHGGGFGGFHGGGFGGFHGGGWGGYHGGGWGGYHGGALARGYYRRGYGYGGYGYGWGDWGDWGDYWPFYGYDDSSYYYPYYNQPVYYVVHVRHYASRCHNVNHSIWHRGVRYWRTTRVCHR